MIVIQQVDLTSKEQVQQFIRFPYQIYAGCTQWVPPFDDDVKLVLNKKKHPFYEHSDADFFVALRDGEIAGRIAALENRPFNRVHNAKEAEFYLFECVNDQEVANALFNHVFEWARARGLERVVGPKGFGPLDGYGIQVEGFEERQMMNMMNYNHPYYVTLVENLGFTKEVEFISCYVINELFHMPEKVHRAAELVQKRGTFEVLRFKNKTHLKSWAKKIGVAYNNTFVNNWEYYPLSDGEISLVLENVMMVADPKLIKIITHKEDVVGFLFAFPDVSAAMQRAKGQLNPLSIADLLLDFRRTRHISFNGMGVLPQYHGMGGNALLYSELEKTVNEFQRFEHAELTQVADTAVQMRKDLQNLGTKPYKNHRVYQIRL